MGRVCEETGWHDHRVAVAAAAVVVVVVAAAAAAYPLPIAQEEGPIGFRW